MALLLEVAVAPEPVLLKELVCLYWHQHVQHCSPEEVPVQEQPKDPADRRRLASMS